MPKVKGQMPKAKTIDIEHLVKLASLELSETEKKTFQNQLQEVLTYISKLQEVNTDKTEPIGHITGLENVNRQDEPTPSLTQESALKNTHKTHNGFFQVDSIFQEE